MLFLGYVKKIKITENEEIKYNLKYARFRNYEDLKIEVLKVDWDNPEYEK
ncbi:hypothetical protein QIU18_10100 [Capnocytophaga canimorsus]|nr:hypothetical protein [Capnocytophaga canimorsus]WGU68977.1 hypothetical protein QIU19_03565 [Capnocytophaga canimorsus]WGU69913.1 hypothetical protein QIU18_10100 [Capnocytophaga canimorsus]